MTDVQIQSITDFINLRLITTHPKRTNRTRNNISKQLDCFSKLHHSKLSHYNKIHSHVGNQEEFGVTTSACCITQLQNEGNSYGPDNPMSTRMKGKTNIATITSDTRKSGENLYEKDLTGLR